ncbi:MAG: hypothetical protein JOS17DRAFT_54047 [Linnemannia elongata]|nr:MAG: hypothetical protein JOS17DRAFT_54047 [Linnemannia elongata]
MGSKLGLYCSIACTIVCTSTAFHLTLLFTFFLPASHCHARGCLVFVCMVMAGRVGVDGLFTSFSFSLAFFYPIDRKLGHLWEHYFSSPFSFQFYSTSTSLFCPHVHSILFCEVVA